jgi:arylsulfatase A-like enzyme
MWEAIDARKSGERTVLETLDRPHLADDTLVLFTSDNGGLYHYWEAKEADDVEHYRITGRAAHIREFGHQANAWMRGTKADIGERGHRVPFLVRWLGKTPAGEVSHELVDLTDLLATVAAIVGADVPAGAGPDSVNILPALLAAKPASPCASTPCMSPSAACLQSGKLAACPTGARWHLGIEACDGFPPARE